MFRCRLHIMTSPGYPEISLLLTEYTCQHCGRVFKSDKLGKAKRMLNGHLNGCKMRIRLRFLKVGDAVIILNTRTHTRKLTATLNKYVQIKQRTLPEMIGVLKYIQMRQEITDANMIEIKNSPEFSKMTDGIKSKLKITSSLSKPDQTLFVPATENLHNHRLDHIQVDYGRN